MFEANFVKNQEAHSSLWLIFRKKKLPFLNNVKFTAEGDKRQMLPVADGRQHRQCIIPQNVTHSLVLLKMGKIISRNLLS